jgi:glycosyltransferase involved in cell wall biosynthesis
LLVLPSSLEGLPLVVIEALSCGAKVVATNVIGTAEAVGRDNAIDLGDDFIERFTNRGAQLLEGNIDQQLPPEVSWTATAVKENKIYQSYIN